MAIAAVLEAMNLPQQKGFHPFFDKSWRDTSKPKTPALGTISGDEQNPSLQVTPQSANDRDVDFSQTPAFGLGNIAERKGKKRGRKSKTTAAFNVDNLNSEQSAKPAEDGPVLEQQNNGHVDSVIERLQEGTDGSSHDVKRRRLSPPEELGSWFDQLQREARDESERKNRASVFTGQPPEAIVSKEHIDETGNRLSPGYQASSNQNGDQKQNTLDVSTMASDPLMVIDLESTTGSNDNKGFLNNAQKVLQLNGNGGFASSSPKMKLHKADENEDGQHAPRTKRNRQRKTMIVVIHYGATANPGHEPLSQRIQRILDQPSSLENANPVPQPISRAAQATQPGKLTHPFFLGKATSSQAPRATITHASITQPGMSIPQPTFKSFSTPGKLRAQLLSSTRIGIQDDDQKSRGLPHRDFRLPGTMEPAWPPKSFQRINPPSSFSRPTFGHYINPKPRKEKHASQSVQPQEQLVTRMSRRLKTHVQADIVESPKQMPQRLVLTGGEIRLRVCKELSASFVDALATDMRSGYSGIHPAVKHLWKLLPNSSSPYDYGLGDSQLWTSKYAPQVTQNVLQKCKETLALKEWLSKHTVANVEGKLSSSMAAKQSSKTVLPSEKGKPRHRVKQSKANGLDDFIVESDEDDSEMLPLNAEDLSIPIPSQGSVIRDQQSTSVKQANAILISGPNGCGKTAAIFAVAKELGFEIFEINAGSRRSGKDILDKVGNMTLNHQVRQTDSGAISANISDIDESLPLEPDEQQPTLASFFAAKGANKAGKKQLSKTFRQAEERLIKASRHKQSLILLEEVDILYEDDKQFWETVLDLALQSKRPIVLTCTNESIVPLKALSLHAILRFRTPLLETTVDYLLLVAATEGHLISRKAVAGLYCSRNMDLRASIMDLNFWCQMGIGAPKAGIDWFLPRWPPGVDRDSEGRKLRVMSNQSFTASMNIFGGPNLSDEDILRGAWSGFSIDPSFVSEQACCMADVVSPSDLTPRDQYAFLAEFDRCAEILSATDVFSRVDLPASSTLHDSIDPTEPTPDAKSLADYVQGYPLLDVQNKTDWRQIDTTLNVSVHLGVKRYFESQLKMFSSSTGSNEGMPLVAEAAVQCILGRTAETTQKSHLVRAEFSAAFDPISEPPSTQSNAVAHSSGLSASSFDRPLSLITTDLAPYVRLIVYYDQILEDQRQRLSNLLSQSSAGKSSKRLRTTRASRSALEGSKRATIRRERWFDAKNLDFDVVLRTGGASWPKVVAFDDTTPTASMESISRSSSADPLAVEQSS